MTKYNLLCMSFDGDFKIEDNRGESFASIDEAWAQSDDMGSRWYFYPFHFVVTESNLTIADVPDFMGCFDFAKRKRVKTIGAIFNLESKTEEAQGMGWEDFSVIIIEPYNLLLA